MEQIWHLRLNEGIHKIVDWPDRTLTGGTLTIKAPDADADAWIEIEGVVASGTVVFDRAPESLPAYPGPLGVWDMLVDVEGIASRKYVAGGSVIFAKGVGGA